MWVANIATAERLVLLLETASIPMLANSRRMWEDKINIDFCEIPVFWNKT
jgi:hypothetical protein